MLDGYKEETTGIDAREWDQYGRRERIRSIYDLLRITLACPLWIANVGLLGGQTLG